MFKVEYVEGDNYSGILLNFHINRRPYYYIRNVIVPILLTTSLAFTAFFYEIDDLEQRNNGTATTFLTTVAFLYVITALLPKTNYSTLINSAVVLSFVVQFSIWALANLNFSLFKVDPDSAQTVELFASIFLPVIYYASTAFLIVPKLLTWHCRSGGSKPAKAQLQTDADGIRDWQLPIYSKKNELEFFPFARNGNVFY